MLLIFGMFGCKDCKTAVDYCTNEGIEFEYYQLPMDELVQLGRKHNLRSAPIIQEGDRFMSFQEFKNK